MYLQFEFFSNPTEIKHTQKRTRVKRKKKGGAKYLKRADTRKQMLMPFPSIWKANTCEYYTAYAAYSLLKKEAEMSPEEWKVFMEAKHVKDRAKYWKHRDEYLPKERIRMAKNKDRYEPRKRASEKKRMENPEYRARQNSLKRVRLKGKRVDPEIAKELNRKKRAYRKKNPQISKNANARYKAKHPEKVKANSTRKSLRRRAIMHSVPIGEKKIIDWFINLIATEEIMRCYYCDKLIPVGKDRTIDHVIAITRGGPHSIENLACACMDCNRHKKNMRLKDWDYLPQMFFDF